MNHHKSSGCAYLGTLYPDAHAAVKVALWDFLSGYRSWNAPGVLADVVKLWEVGLHESPAELFAHMERSSFELPGELTFLEESEALIDLIEDIEQMKKTREDKGQ